MKLTDEQINGIVAVLVAWIGLILIEIFSK